MSVLTAYFNPEISQNPEERKDFLLEVVATKDGGEETVEKLVNYTKIQESNGKVENWDTATMKKAGVDIKHITPKTDKPTRLEGQEEAARIANEFINEVKKTIKNK